MDVERGSRSVFKPRTGLSVAERTVRTLELDRERRCFVFCVRNECRWCNYVSRTSKCVHVEIVALGLVYPFDVPCPLHLVCNFLAPSYLYRTTTKRHQRLQSCSPKDIPSQVWTTSVIYIFWSTIQEKISKISSILMVQTDAALTQTLTLMIHKEWQRFTCTPACSNINNLRCTVYAPH
jgi:hypothetical protein